MRELSALNMHFPSRKANNDSEGNSRMVGNATPTPGPGGKVVSSVLAGEATSSESVGQDAAAQGAGPSPAAELKGWGCHLRTEERHHHPVPQSTEP